MNAQWRRAEAAPPERGLILDAVLMPHRSLSLARFRWLMWAFAGLNLAIAILFVAHGAYPVVGFLGLDVFAVWLAFHLNYRAARRRERVCVGAEQLYLGRASESGGDHWVVSPLWAKVRHDDAAGVRIMSGGMTMRVGAFLSPKEQGALAKALDSALWRARRS